MPKKSTRAGGVKKTWKPTTAGILSIVAGAGELFGGIGLGAASGLIGSILGMPGLGIAIGIPLIILGIVAIVGGVFALRRRVWGLALAGAICSLFMYFVAILGILAIIFVAMSKKEFK
jgi:hypothetical protein